jgi:hypothetical protein
VIFSLQFIKKPSQLKTAGRPDMAEALESIRKPRPDYRFAVGLISLGLKSDAIEKSRQAHEGDNAHDGFSYFYFSQQDIKKKYKSLIEAEAGIREDDLHFCGSTSKTTVSMVVLGSDRSARQSFSAFTQNIKRNYLPVIFVCS